MKLDVVDFEPIDSLTLVIVGHDGSITRTTNGGLDWHVERSVAGVTGTLNGVQFIGVDRGFAVGESGGNDSLGVILRTDDGGAGWSVVDPGMPLTPLQRITFAPDLKHGWITGAEDLQLRTHDGGENWERIIPQPLGNLSGEFVDSLHGFALSGPASKLSGDSSWRALWWTRDGGETWDSVYRFVGVDEVTVDFADTGLGWCGFTRYTGIGVSYLCKTTDGGRTWASLQWQRDARYRKVICVDHRRTVVATENKGAFGIYFGSIIETYDQGTTWATVATSPAFPSEMKCGLTGSVWARMRNGAIFRSGSPGMKWATTLAAKEGNPRAIAHVPGHSLWAVAGGEGWDHYEKMSVSPDTGRSWIDAPCPTEWGRWMLTLSFPQGLDGWSSGGRLLRTTNGGMTWFLPEAGPPGNSYKGLFSADPWTTWVAGRSEGARSTDGGASWEIYDQPSGLDPQAIWFVSPLRGFGVSNDYATILRTLNGGATWDRIEGITTPPLTSIFFVSPFHGWVVGSNGGVTGNGAAILRTTDGGGSWNPSNPVDDPYLTLKCVMFIDTLRGWAVGQGIILGTSDGGLTWEAEHRSAEVFYGLDVSDGSLAMAIGDYYTTLALEIPVESVPPPPLQFAPSPDVAGLPSGPDFHWYPPRGGGSYHLQVSEDSLFGTLAVDASNLKYHWRQVRSLNPLTVYHWRVRAKNRLGFSEWSPVWRFTTGVFPPDQVMPVSPARGASIFRDSIRFIWRPTGMGTTRYWAEVGTDSLFRVSEVDSTLTDTTWVPDMQLAAQVLWWRVRAGNSYGWGPFSVPRSIAVVLSGIDERAEFPADLALHQNYPNPFNPSTTIKYELPRSSMVRLSVYDMLGREVAVLVNEGRDAGVHEVKFDASSLSSGMYFYRLQAGDFVQTRKLLLVR